MSVECSDTRGTSVSILTPPQGSATIMEEEVQSLKSQSLREEQSKAVPSNHDRTASVVDTQGLWLLEQDSYKLTIPTDFVTIPTEGRVIVSPHL